MTAHGTLHDFDIEDMPYLTHGDQALLARVYTPKGPGPFPAVIELHGGAWSRFDRTRGEAVHKALAASGLVVVALDFRQGAEGAYPKSPADINYGIRWVKANGERLKVDPARVGLTGNSSGGHLAMLVAMRPRDPAFAAIPLPGGGPQVDATVGCVAMCWPVINPSGRYRYAQHLVAEGDAPSWAHEVIPLHDTYWGTFQAMQDGNPMLMLERGDPAELPPALWISAARDDVHNYKDIESPFPGSEPARFVHNYRQAGGEIEFVEFDADGMFTVLHPTLPASVAAMRALVEFCHRHLAA